MNFLPLTSKHPRPKALALRLAWALMLGGWCLAGYLRAATWTEDFSHNPLTNGWQAYGETNLFAWDATNQNLVVTWDSSYSNSFFARPFGTILTKQDDFTFAFDLRLTDIAVGIASNKPNTFQVALGLVNLVNATNPAVWRGTGQNSQHGARNTCEFDYFSAANAINYSFSPTMVSSNSLFSPADDIGRILDTGVWFRITMNYTAATRTLTTTGVRYGTNYSTVPDIVFPSSRDFRFDRFAVISWSDVGTTDSILAHGVVDNITVTVPSPAVQNFGMTRTNTTWLAQFGSRTNFIYTLERTADLQTWSSASASTAGTGGVLSLLDTNAPSARIFYRIRTERP